MIKQRADNEGPDGEGSAGAGSSRVRPARAWRRAAGARGPAMAAGLSKERARFDDWCKEIAPSTELRKWYGHDPDRYAEFARRYRAELGDPVRAAALANLRKLAGHGQLTLLTATKRSDISEAAVLADLLARR